MPCLSRVDDERARLALKVPQDPVVDKAVQMENSMVAHIVAFSRYGIPHLPQSTKCVDLFLRPLGSTNYNKVIWLTSGSFIDGKIPDFCDLLCEQYGANCVARRNRNT